MVLLDLANKQLGSEQLVCAHFQHNLRSSEETEADLKVIKSYCDERQIKLAVGSYDGTDFSEATLRKARYQFLHAIKADEGCQAIATAHHADDVIETAIINILRGTKGAGLVSLRSTDEILRPLLDVKKSAIRSYASENSIRWHDDSTNSDEAYLRNYVRMKIVPELEKSNNLDNLVHSINAQMPIEIEMQELVDGLLSRNCTRHPGGISLDRSFYIQLPHQVSLKLMHSILSGAEFTININSTLVSKSVVFAKTARNGSSMDLSKNTRLLIRQDSIEVLQNH